MIGKQATVMCYQNKPHVFYKLISNMHFKHTPTNVGMHMLKHYINLLRTVIVKVSTFKTSVRFYLFSKKTCESKVKNIITLKGS